MRHIKDFSSFIFESDDDSTIWYYGIADSHGIESFLEAPSQIDIEAQTELLDMGLINKEESKKMLEDFNKTLSMMAMRAKFNEHRRSLVYMVELTKYDADRANELFDSGKYIDALNYIKETALTVKGASPSKATFIKWWESIPNPQLDPYH